MIGQSVKSCELNLLATIGPSQPGSHEAQRRWLFVNIQAALC